MLNVNVSRLVEDELELIDGAVNHRDNKFLSVDQLSGLSLDFQIEQGNIWKQQDSLNRKIRKYRVVLKNWRKLQRSIHSYNQKNAIHR